MNLEPDDINDIIKLTMNIVRPFLQLQRNSLSLINGEIQNPRRDRKTNRFDDIVCNRVQNTHERNIVTTQPNIHLT